MTDIERGEQLVDGWITYTIHGRPRVRTAHAPTAAAGSGKVEHGGALVTDKFDASDLDGRNWTEAGFTRLRCDAYPTEVLKAILIAKHEHGVTSERWPNYMAGPIGEWDLMNRGLCVTSAFLIEAALIQFYALVGRLWREFTEAEEAKRAERARAQELKERIADGGWLVANLIERLGLSQRKLAAALAEPDRVDALLAHIQQWQSGRRAVPVLFLHQAGERFGLEERWWRKLTRPVSHGKKVESLECLQNVTTV